MKIVAIVCRILLGLMFVVFGANGLHPFLPMKMDGMPQDAITWMTIMMQNGYMQHISACMLIGGLLVLYGGTAPLGLCILGPILVNILFFHVCFMHGGGIGMGLIATLLEIVLIYAYRNSFSGIFSTKEQPS